MGKDDLDLPWLDNVHEDEDAVLEEVSRSYEVVKKLLPFMGKRGIPVTPKNYRLFYDYITFANPEINKFLNSLMEKDVRFSDQLTNGLYAVFYADEGAELAAKFNALKTAASTFLSVSDNMSESLKQASDQNVQFQAVLTNTSRQMVESPHADEFQGYLADLLTETDHTLAAANALSDRLREANEIIDSLQENLKVQTALTKVDELTKLSNRRHLNLDGPRFIREAQESGRPLSAIIFDLDLFKRVNDSWGHASGDKVLVICANIIKSAARQSDLAVRLGGEEFLLLCSNLDLATAAKVADRVRQSIASTPVDLQSPAVTVTVTVTVSGGVASYNSEMASFSLEEDLSALIARADAALYQAKADGRNRICVADADGVRPLLPTAGKER
jgi:diguanylate cyclase